MKKGKIENKFGIFLILGLALAVFSSTVITADVNVKNISVETNYFGGENIKGWINMSLTDEPYDSLVSGFNTNIHLLNFLNNNNLKDKAGFSCSVVNCLRGYSVNGPLSGFLNLAEGTTTFIGFKIYDPSTGVIGNISRLLINISTDAATQCSENMQVPLKIDILDDNSSEWSANASSYGGSSPPICWENGEKNYGCFDSDIPVDEYQDIITTPYCEKIKVGPGAGIYAGVDIIPSSGGDANFTITLNLPGQSSREIHVVSAEGNHGAYFNSSSEYSRDVTVCIKAKNSASGGRYKLGVQTKSDSCGYSSAVPSVPHDFSIYAEPIAYSVPGQFVLDFFNNKKIRDYITQRHSNNCSNGCIIPIKITSNQNQNLIINEMRIEYLKSDGFPESDSTIQDITTISPTISMDCTLLDISKAGLIVPSVNGNYTLNFKIGEIYSKSKQISVSDMPTAGFVFPYEVIVFEDTIFSAYSSSSKITSYKWNFGDGSPEQITINNSAVHKYNSEGNYTLNITAISSQGQAYSAFQISVIALSKENLLILLNKNRENLVNIETEISKLPVWIKDYLVDKVIINSTKTEINNFISSINSTTNLTKVSFYLSSLRVASSFGISEISSGTLIVNPSKINPASLKNAGAGSMNSDVDESFYKNAIYGWLIDNMNINVEEKVYSLFYTDKNEPLGSYFKVTLTPKKDYTGKLFLAIDKNFNSIIFKDRQQTKNESQTTIIILNGSSSSREIEFFVKERVDPANMPIYLSPEFSKLDIFSNPKCFIDGKCDSNMGENNETCPADCNSRIWKMIISIVILLMLAFIVYIILQEWYKRRYEGYLFKNKDDLYNVINFISNGEKQSMPKNEIFKNLLDMKWSNEQLVFAYNKFHGKRTGMYEIPIFKIFERNKVQREIDKRKINGNFGTVAPRPIIVPPQKLFMGGQNKNLQQNQNKKI